MISWTVARSQSHRPTTTGSPGTRWAQTDALEEPVVAALGAAIDDVIAELNIWSAACVAAGTYPPDQYRRAGA
jgi:hypothetical protein